MITFTMPVPARAWSTNQDRNMNPYERAALIKLWKVAAKTHYRSHFGKAALAPSIVQIDIGTKTNAKRDPHNYCGTVLKAVIDGLVMAGCWPDDTPRWVGHREPIFHKGEGVTVTLTPM